MWRAAMTVAIILGCCLTLLLLGIAAAVGGRGRLNSARVYGATAAICLLAFVAAVTGRDGALVLPIGLPWLGAHFSVDRLATVFLALIDLGSAGAALYAIGYGRHEHAPQRVLPFFPAFIAGMNLVVIAADAYSFLFAWELMSLASWALVMSDHRAADSQRAGIVYLIMATFSALTLLLAFGLLAAPHGGSGFAYAFAEMRTGTLPPWRSGLVLTLVLVGAGSKAGLMPLHAWLPLAHPAAPSHVSALMSGVMTKVAVYAFIRIVFDLLGPTTWWWAVPVLTAGGSAAVLGVLQALMERDLKRLLAFSTIENIGSRRRTGLAKPVLAMAMESSQPMAVCASLEALAIIGTRQTLDALRAKYPDAAEVAGIYLQPFLKLLGHTAGPESIEEICRTIERKGAFVHETAIDALTNIALRHNVSQLNSFCEGELCGLLKPELDAGVCFHLIRLLGHFTGSSRVALAVLPYIHDPDRTLGLAAVESLANSSDPAVESALHSLLSAENDPEIGEELEELVRRRPRWNSPLSNSPN